MRKITAIILALGILLSIAVIPAAAWEPISEGDGIKIYIDERRVDQKGLSYTEEEITYVPLREIANVLGANAVTWDDNTKTAKVTDEGLTLTAEKDSNYIVANGRYLFVPGLCRGEDGAMMVPVRAICKAFGVEVRWDQNLKAIYITSGGEPIESGDSFYDSDDVYWLSRLIQAESGGEEFEGQIAVGNVVMNRIESGQFPDTVEGVVFDSKFGIQFTPAHSGAIYNTPSESCIIAAKLALDGAETVGDCLYFSAAYASCWASRNREFVVQIDNQKFYA